MITASMLRLPRFAPFTAKTPAQRNSRSGPNLSTVATLTSRAPPAIPAMLIIEIPPTDPSTAAMRTTALAGGGATEAIESGKAEPDGAHADRTDGEYRRSERAGGPTQVRGKDEDGRANHQAHAGRRKGKRTHDAREARVTRSE